MKKDRLMAAVSLTIGLFVSACSQAPVEGGLEAQFGRAGSDLASEVATNAAHPYVFVAGTYDGEKRVFIREYNKNGRFIWERLLPGFVGYTYAESVGTDKAGNAYLIYVGDSYPDPYEEVNERYLVKFSQSGQQLWRRTLSPDSSGSLIVDHQSNIWVTLNEGGAVLQKYAPDGRMIYDSGFFPKLYIGRLAVSSTNDLYAEIADFRGCNEEIYAYCDFHRKLRKYAPDGQVKFDRVVSGNDKNIDGIGFGANTIFVTYRSEGAPGRPIYVNKYNTSGKLLKTRTIATGAEDYTVVRGVGADNDGNLYLSGAISSENPNSSNMYDPYEDDFFVSKYSPSLSSEWTYRADLSGTYGIARSVVPRTSGEIYVAGASNGKVNGKSNQGYDAFLLRLNAQGKKVFIR